MLLAGYDALRNLGPCVQLVAVEVAQFKAGYQQAAQTTVQVSLFDVAALNSCRQIFVFRTTLHIGACQNSFGRSLCTVFGHMVPRGQEVANGSAVAGNQSLKSPFVAQDLLLIAALGTTSLSVNTLVGTHHLCHLAFLHQCLEGRQIGLPKVTLGQILDVKGMAVPLRSAVYGKVLGTSQQLTVFADTQVFTIIANTLQSTYYGQSHLRGQIGIFAVGLLSASPARITEDVDVGGPKRQTLVAFNVARALSLLGFYTSLVTNSSEYLVE